MIKNYYHLNSFGIIQVDGQDAKSFLHSQLSNDINGLQANEACFATYNSPKGRVLANFLVCQLPDLIFMILKKDLIDSIIKKLEMYKMRCKVNFIDSSAQYQILGTLNTSKIHSIPYPLKFSSHFENDMIEINCPNGTQFLLAKKDKKLELSIIENENDWNIFEIKTGFAWICLATSNRSVAQMLNSEIYGAIHFKKGCYPGQEIIARSQYRGEVKRRPMLFSSLEKPEIGCAIKQNEEEIGLIFNTAKENNQYLILAITKINIEPNSYLIIKEKQYPLTLIKSFYFKKAD